MLLLSFDSLYIVGSLSIFYFSISNINIDGSRYQQLDNTEEVNEFMIGLQSTCDDSGDVYPSYSVVLLSNCNV